MNDLLFKGVAGKQNAGFNGKLQATVLASQSPAACC
jgi:hypothetical protein